MKKFDELFTDQTSKGKKIPKEKYLSSGRFPIIDQGQQYIAGYTNSSEGIYSDVPAIIFGDHTRVIKYVDFPFFLGADGVKLLKSKDPDANYKYLYYALRNAKIPNTGYNRHFKWLKQISLSYPAKSKQEQIVKILNTIENIIKSRKAEVDQLDTLIKSRFVEMFGDLKSNDKNWKMMAFTEIAKIDTTMIHDFHGYEDYPHIGIDSIEKNTGRIIEYRTVKEDGVISGKYLFTPKHIIYSKIRPNLNKVALPDFTGVCSADAYPILVKEGVCNREYLAYVMRSSYFLDYVMKFSNRTNLPKVNRKQVEGFICPIPPIDFQNKFADFVHQVDKSKLAIQKSLDETQLLFDSLMQQYFE